MLHLRRSKDVLAIMYFFFPLIIRLTLSGPTADPNARPTGVPPPLPPV